MARRFKTVNYAESLKQTVTLEDCLPPEHLVRFIVGIIALLDLSRIYAYYALVGGEAIAPEILLGLLLYSNATDVFSSRKIEKATYESIPFRFIAGGLHPDHSTLAEFRKTFLPEITELFVQVLVVAHEAGVLNLGNISLDGSKIHAHASKSNAVSYRHLLELRQHLQVEVEELLALGEKADQTEWPDGMNMTEEILLLQTRLTHLDMAKAILEIRAKERYAAEQAEYEAKLRAREEEAQETGHKPRGHAPQPQTLGPHDTDQYNFTDPESRIMKNSTNAGFDPHYNVQVAVEQDTLLIVGNALSNHPNDQAEALPTADAIPAEIGKPKASALDNGYFSPRM